MMKLSVEETPALILIDIQKGFDYVPYWGRERNNPDAEPNAAALLTHWRACNMPVFHVQHCSVNPESPLHESNAGNKFKDMVLPCEGEVVVKKSVNSAFIQTPLSNLLDQAGIRKVVIAGLTTDHCVSTTTRMAGNFGYQTYVVSDATATFNKTGANGQNYPAAVIHETALASLNNEFATVITTALMINLLKPY